MTSTPVLEKPILQTRAPARRAPGPFHLVLAVLMTGIVVLGFWPFYSRLPAGGGGAHPVIYVHAAVFSGWMLLLLTQTALVWRRRVRVHQRLGRFGIGYGVLVLLLGLAVTFVAPIQNVRAGRASLDDMAGFLVLPLGDMLLFAVFFAAGIAYRRRKELHKRLMLLATVALLFAPAARAGDPSLVAIILLWLSPLLLAMGRDLYVERRIAPVYVVGLLTCLIAVSRIRLMESEIWLGPARRVLGALVGD